MQYRYVGDGAGVPGLPHEISDEEAQAQGCSELLQAAIANGSYVAVPPAARVAATSPRFQKAKPGGDENEE